MDTDDFSLLTASDPVYATESQPTALLVYHANYPDGSDPTHESALFQRVDKR